METSLRYQLQPTTVLHLIEHWQFVQAVITPLGKKLFFNVRSPLSKALPNTLFQQSFSIALILLHACFSNCLFAMSQDLVAIVIYLFNPTVLLPWQPMVLEIYQIWCDQL